MKKKFLSGFFMLAVVCFLVSASPVMSSDNVEKKSLDNEASIENTVPLDESEDTQESNWEEETESFDDQEGEVIEEYQEEYESEEIPQGSESENLDQE